jgi:hypothetical protein
MDMCPVKSYIYWTKQGITCRKVPEIEAAKN